MMRMKRSLPIILLISMGCHADDVQNGITFFKQKEYVKAAGAFKKGCDNNSMDGCYYMSSLYAEGLGVKKDLSKAIKLLEQSCNGGHPYGCGDLANAYQKGEHIKQDKAKAAELFAKACNADDSESCSMVGMMYASGDGVEQNDYTAKIFFKKGCELNNESSCKNYTVLSGETIFPTKVCLNIEKVNSSMTPVELYTYGYYCVAENKYEEAGKLFLTGMAYGAYDRLRVKDNTAHQATSVIQMQIGSSLSEEQREKLQETMKSTMREKSTCEMLQNIGKPSYFPAYMINHGLDAQNPQPIVADFDSEKGWDSTLRDYIKCKGQ